MLLLPWECGNPMNTFLFILWLEMGKEWECRSTTHKLYILLLFKTSDRVQTWLLFCSAREHHPKSQWQGANRGGREVEAWLWWDTHSWVQTEAPELQFSLEIKIFLAHGGGAPWFSKLTFTICTGLPQGCTMRASQTTVGSILTKLPGEGRSGKFSTWRQVWLLLPWSGQTRHQGDQPSTLGQIPQPSGGGDVEPESPPLRVSRMDRWVAVKAKGLA